jgi:hypothetical protein
MDNMTDIIEPDLTPAEARSLTDNIRAALSDVWPMFKRAYAGRVWLALGYATWDNYCDTELAGVRPPIESREQRQAIVGDLRQAGMSNRGIAAAVGISHPTVISDLRAGGQDLPPATVQGADGKSYASARPQAQPAPMPPADPWAGWTADERAMRERVEAGEIIVASLRGQHTRVIGWAERSGKYERVDRRSQWGNPFEMPADGDRETVIKNYEDHYLPYKPSITVKLGNLRGKLIGCWCAPEPCHADVLKRWAER